MAGKSVLELAVGTGKWDSGLRKAQQSLNRFVQANGGLDKALAKNSDNVGKFVKMMGDMNSTATTAKGKMGEYKKAIEQLTSQFNSMSDAQKKAVGHEYTGAIDKLKGKYREAADEVSKLNRELNDVAANNQKAASGGGLLGGGLKGGLGSIAGKLGWMGAGATALKAISDNINTAMNFESAVSQLSSLTGKTGEELEKLKNYAIDLGSSTTLSASQVADAFKMIGSQQPQLLESGEALRDVTQAAITLSEAAGIELASAAQSLSTSINQFGGDSSNATRFVNVLAAASQKGAGDIEFLGEAISKSGVLANAVGVSYEELVANLEQLAQAGIDAGTSGTALRSIIASLENQSNNEYKPSVVGLTQAFANLGNAHLSVSEYAKLAGKQFFSQAMILADNAQKAKELQKEITGTNTAEEQARVNTDNLQGSLKSLASAWEGLNLHINDSNGFLRSCVDWLKDVIVWADRTFTSLGRVQRKQAEINSQNGGDVVGTDLDKLRVNNSDSAYKVLLARYNREVNERQELMRMRNEWVNNHDEGLRKTIVSRQKALGITSNVDLEQSLKAWIDFRNAFVSGAKNIISPTKMPTSDTTPTTPTGGSTTPKKGGKGGGGGHTKTPAERAEEVVNSALMNYAETIYKADLRMDAGLDDTLAHKKVELQALSQLMDSYARASAIYEDPKYKDAYKETAEQYQSLAHTIKETEDEQKKTTEWLKAGEKENHGLIKMGGERETLEQKVKLNLANSITEADQETLRNLLEVTIKNSLEGVNIPSDILEQLIFGEQSLDIPDEYWQGLVNQINEKLKEKGLDAIKLDTETGNVSTESKQSSGFSDLTAKVGKLTDGLADITNGLTMMGVKIPEGLNQAIGVMQGLMSVVQGVQSVIQLFATSSQTANTVAVTANTAAVAALTTAMATNTLTNFIPLFSGGGVARAANGLLGGNRYSGDQMPVMVNSGELILNRAQQGNIASQLEGGAGTIQMEARIQGEDIVLATRNVDRRRGKGEVVRSR